MTITLELPPDLEARFVAEAQAKGVPVGEVVTAAEELDRALEEAADLIPEGVPPLSDDAMSRESIYTREDDWNR